MQLVLPNLREALMYHEPFYLFRDVVKVYNEVVTSSGYSAPSNDRGFV